MDEIIAKLSIRKLKDGGYYVQGVITGSDIEELPFNDQLCIVAMDVKEIEDRTPQYAGKSNALIKAEGFL